MYPEWIVVVDESFVGVKKDNFAEKMFVFWEKKGRGL